MEKNAAFFPDQGKLMHTSLTHLSAFLGDVGRYTTQKSLGSFFHLHILGSRILFRLGPSVASPVGRVRDLPFKVADLVGGVEVDAGHATASRDCTLKQAIEIQVLKDCEAEFANMNQEVYSRNTQLPPNTRS